MAPPEPKRGFASDNNSGIHPEVLAAIAAANIGHVVAYGDDPYTARAQALFEQAFGPAAKAYPVFNGTAANVLCLGQGLRSFQAVICTESAHIANDECGAPERWLGTKLLTVPAADGKLTPELCATRLQGIGDPHHVQARALSIAQCTELGTVYSAAEIRALADFAHSNGMILHLDGARLSNAAAALGATFRELTTDAGVDALSFGGTKNGLMLGEAVVLLNPALGADIEYLRKQAMQLSSKMRFVSAQFEAFLGSDLWRRNALRANAMARRLADGAAKLAGVRLARKPEANLVFAWVPTGAARRLQRDWFFYTVSENSGNSLVRWVASFDTTEHDVDAFLRDLAGCLGT